MNKFLRYIKYYCYLMVGIIVAAVAILNILLPFYLFYKGEVIPGIVLVFVVYPLVAALFFGLDATQ